MWALGALGAAVAILGGIVAVGCSGRSWWRRKKWAEQRRFVGFIEADEFFIY
jgi:hypothetical protein